MAGRPVNPLALGFEWAARVFAAVAMMCLPGLGGQWLDKRWGTGFLALSGFAIGLVGGMAYLIRATQSLDRQRKSRPNNDGVDDSASE